MDEPERQRIVTILAGQIDIAPSDRSVFLCYLHPFRGEWAIPTAAFSVTARNFLFAEAIWDDAQGDDVNERWLRRAMATVERTPSGTT